MALLALSGFRDTNAWAWRFALDARDIWRHPVAMGKWIKENIPPDQVVALHDAGGMPYYSEHGRFLDLVGLGTNGMGPWYRSGPGAFFERLESLSSDEQPSYFAVYTDWFEDVDILGAARHEIFLERTSIVPNPSLRILEARRDQFGVGHQPWTPEVTSSHVLDAVDFADLDSEEIHGFLPGARRGATRYMRGRTADGLIGGDGARWLRAEVGFSLSAVEGRGVKLGFRLASDSDASFLYRLGDRAPETIAIKGDGLLRDYIVGLSEATEGTRLQIWGSPGEGQEIFLARAYLVGDAPTP